jgi:4'-phosphopantetheinyl transferase
VSGEASAHGCELLSQDEKERADRFRQPEDRWRFTVGRASLRSLLGQYQQLDPRSLCFIYNESGKPALAPLCNPAGLSFSVAHSGAYVLVACGSGLTVGVDIEHLRMTRNADLVAKSLLAAAEYAQWMMKPPELRKRDILQEWTRREAVGKALGSGISAALSDYKTVLGDPARWTIRDIDMDEDYVAALAAQTADLQLYLYE